MNITQRLQKAAYRFLARVNPDAPIHVLENPTEELDDAIARRQNLKLFYRDEDKGNAEQRLEENYLFASRRFPGDVGNVIGAGALPNGEFPFFNQPIGGDGAVQGFPTGFRLSGNETNLDEPNRVTKGKNFLMRELGVTFNAEAFADNIEQVLDSGSLLFTKQGGQWTLKQGPANFWPGGHGLSGFSTRQAVEHAHTGTDLLGVRKLRVPRVLEAGDNFDYQLIVPRPTRATNGTAFAVTDFVIMRIWLFGAQVDNIPQ